MTRDKDGFLVLKRRIPGYDDQVFRVHIGNSIIFMGEDKIGRASCRERV